MHSKLMKSYDRSEVHKEAQIENVEGESQSLKNSRQTSPTKDIEAKSRPRNDGNCATKFEQVASKLVFWQALTLTFLGEWGDRSQFTTIALAAESNPYFVFVGSFLVIFLIED